MTSISHFGHDRWLLDSGASHHIACTPYPFFGLHPVDTSKILLGDKKLLDVVGVGNLEISDVCFRDVLCIPKFIQIFFQSIRLPMVRYRRLWNSLQIIFSLERLILEKSLQLVMLITSLACIPSLIFLMMMTMYLTLLLLVLSIIPHERLLI